MTRRAEFASRLRRRQPLAGIFQKMPAYQTVELIAQTGIDFAVLDAEHAPFDPSQIDASILASHAADLPLLVRVQKNDSGAILAALDMGAAGIFVPRIVSAEDASRVVEAARYLTGNRDFSPSTRAGGYGTRGLASYMEAADREVAIVLQIEDAHALDHLARIATVEGMAGLFVGRGDLAVSMKLAWEDPRLDEATQEVAEAAAKAGIAAGAYLADTSRLAEYMRWGISFFVIGSDQGAMKAGVARIAGDFRQF